MRVSNCGYRGSFLLALGFRGLAGAQGLKSDGIEQSRAHFSGKQRA